MTPVTGVWTSVDGPTLVASAAGLQLFEENVPCLVRLQRLAAIGAALPHQPTALPLNPSRLRSLVRQAPVDTSDVRSQEDLYDDLYVEEVPFYGGASLVLQGLTNRSAHTLRVLLAGIFGPPGQALPEKYRRMASLLTHDVLALSDAVCRAAGLGRHVPPPRRRGGQIFVPGRERLDQLRAAVTFTPDRLAATIGANGAGLAHLTVAAGDHALGFHEGTDDGLVLTPLLSAGDDLIVANPGELAAALRHSLIVLAGSVGCRDELAAAFRNVVAYETATLLDLIGATPEGEWQPAGPLILRRKFKGKANTIFDVAILTDDLSGYDPAEPYGSWVNHTAGTTLQDVLDVPPAAANCTKRLLRLAVTDGVGRQTMFGFGERRTITPFLWTPLDELRVMIELDGSDPLFLWRFADAEDRLHDHARVMSFSVLDTYAVYRDNEQSFYLSDDGVPNMVTVEVASGSPLRAEAHKRIDRHHVLAPDGTHFVEVLKMHGGQSPVYFVNPRHGMSALLIEMPHFTAWVQFAVGNASPPLRRLLHDVAEAVAYWLWQLVAAGEAGAAERLTGRLNVALRADDAGAWERALAGDFAALPPTPRTGAWATAERDGEGTVAIVVHADRHARLLDAANTADRELLQAILGVVVEPQPTAAESEALVEQVAPVGPKKILNAVTAADVTLRPVKVRVRRVQPAVTALLLDDAGAWLSQHGVPPGPIADDDRTAVLGKAVEYYYQRLAAVVAELSPVGLLEFLILQDEALLRDQAYRDRNLDARLTCYGVDPKFAEEMTKEGSRHVEASVASRFLVEYAAARRPAGWQSIDLMTYDELLAIAAELISRATLSDAIHHGFSAVQLSMLRSGRLGVSRCDRYSAGTWDLARVQTTARLALASGAVADSDGARRGGNVDPLPSAQVDAAMTAEFGFTLTDHAHAIGELVNFADDLAAEPASALVADVEAHLVDTLGRDLAKVRQYLGSLTLRPRADFLAIGPDAYPWRYNRDQSYMRRPLIQYAGADGQTRLLWGVRRAWASGHYWMQLIFSGRMRGTTPAMKQLTGWIRQEENSLFECRVADTLRSAGIPHTACRLKRISGRRLVSPNGNDLGDLDALGLDPVRRLVVVAEAKDLEQARTPAELANEADKLLIGVGSAVAKLERRASWVQSHLQNVLDHFGIAGTPSKWRVEAVVVTSTPLISPRVMATGLPVLSLDELAEWVGRGGSVPSRQPRRRRQR